MKLNDNMEKRDENEIVEETNAEVSEAIETNNEQDVSKTDSPEESVSETEDGSEDEGSPENEDLQSEEDIPEAEDSADSDNASENREKKRKPKRKKNRTLVAAAAIFAVTALSFGVWYAFFNNDISGVWATEVEVEDSDGNTKTAVMKFAFDDTEKMSFFENEKSYFSDKETTAKSARMINGGVSYPGWYEVSENDGVNSLQLYISLYQSSFSYEYELSGNIFSGRYLTLTDDDESISFYKSSEGYALDPDEDFTPNTGVVGTWETSDEVVYTFTEEGRFSEDTGDSKTDGTYSFGETDDGYDAIIVKYIRNGSEVTADVPYLLNGDSMTLTFNGYDVELTKKAE